MPPEIAKYFLNKKVKGVTLDQNLVERSFNKTTKKSAWSRSNKLNGIQSCYSIVTYLRVRAYVQRTSIFLGTNQNMIRGPEINHQTTYCSNNNIKLLFMHYTWLIIKSPRGLIPIRHPAGLRKKPSLVSSWASSSGYQIKILWKIKNYYLDLRKMGWMGDIENDLLVQRVSLVWCDTCEKW